MLRYPKSVFTKITKISASLKYLGIRYVYSVSSQLSRRLLSQDLPPRAIGPYPRFSAPVFLLVPSSIISSHLSIQVVFNERRLIDCFFQVVVYRNQYSIIGISLIFHIFHVFSYRKVLKKLYQ